MLCRTCRRQLERGASYCGSCGTPLNGANAPLEIVLSDSTRVPVVSEMTIGRAPGATLVLSDPSVSRVHARISAGYVGAFFNLNPFIERDGYHILVDVLGEPGLRRRAKEQLARKLRGESASTDSPVLLRYSIFGLGWSVLAACFAIVMLLRYEKAFLATGAPQVVVHGVTYSLWVAFFLPVILVLARLLLQRAGPERTVVAGVH